jgi:hypothetical protein
MTLDEMYAELELFGFDYFEDSQKLTLLNEAYFDIVTREPWPFLETVVTVTASVGASKITNNVAEVTNSPSDVNSVLSFIDTTNDIVMNPERGDVIEKNYRLTDSTSTPHTYYFIGEDIFVYPAVSGVTNYRLYYTRTPVGATNNTNQYYIPSRHHSVIVYGALVKAFLVNDDPQSAVYQNLFESRYQQMRNDLWLQQYDRPDRVHMITESADWSY